MALVTTVSPTVSTEDHIPGIPDDSETLAGNIDRNDIEGWGFDSTFAFPTPHFSITPDWGTPATDIGTGTVYRLEPDGQKKHVIGSETGVSLASDSKNYVYFTENDEYEVHDADEPPSGQAVLIATLDTATNTVNTEVRGRTPLPLDFLSPVSGGGAAQFAPIVSTGDADAVADTTAELSGVLDSLGGADSVDVYIQWREAGTGNAWNETTKEAQSQTGPFNANVSGLSAGTQYEFRGVALNPNQANLVGFGITKTFTTTNDGTTQADVTTDAATNITASSVDMNGTLNDLGDDGGTDRSSVDVFFDYESVDGSEASSSGGQTLSATGSFSETVSGLRQDTRYRYRAAARYSGETVYGGWVEFTTSPGTGLTVTTDSATNVGTNEATLNGTVTSFGGAQSASVNFNYRPQGDPVWDQTTIETITTTLGFLDTVDQLVAGTTYEYQARASTSTGSATGTVETFTTDFTGGEVLFIAGDFDVTGYNCATKWDISTATEGSGSDTFASWNGLDWNDDGTRVYTSGGGTLYQYDCSTAYDLTTASNEQSAGGSQGTIQGLTWKGDGTKLFEVGWNNEFGDIVGHNVSTPFDVTTITGTSGSVSAGGSFPSGIAANDDGTKLYIVNQDGEIIEHQLGTAWDLSTETGTTTISASGSFPVGIAWKPDGTKMYEIDNSNVQSWSVSTPFDITTASQLNTLGVSGEDLAWDNAPQY